MLKLDSQFLKNTLTLLCGNGLSQIILILFSPILTRLYTPEYFGIFAIYVSIVNILSTISTGRYELAIVAPRKNADGLNLMILSIFISFCFSLVCAIVILIFNEYICLLFNNYNISSYLYILPISVSLLGLASSFNYFLNRNSQYNNIAFSTMSHSIASTFISVILGLFKFISFNGLILGQVIGVIVKIMINWKNIFYNIQTNNIKYDIKRIIVLCKVYIDYPKKSLIGALSNVISYEGITILFAAFYSSHVLGLFYFINKIISLPNSLLSSSIWQVFLQYTGKSTKEIFEFKYFKQKKIIVLTTFPIIYGILVYPDLFVFVFGYKFSDATIFIPPLIFAMHMNLVVASFSLFLIINRPDAEMVFNICLGLTKLLSIVLSYFIWNDILYTVIIFSSVQFIMFLLLGSWNYKKLGKSYVFFSSIYMPSFIASIALLFVSEILFGSTSLVEKFFIYTFFVSVYFFWIFKWKKNLLN